MASPRKRISVQVGGEIMLAKQSVIRARGFASKERRLSYLQALDDAVRQVSGTADRAFPQEWDVQVLIECAATALGHRVFLFSPRFLAHLTEDDDEVDRALGYFLLKMDGVATKSPYVMVYCMHGLDWASALLRRCVEYLSEILPRSYLRNLQALYVLHANVGFRVSMWMTADPALRSRTHYVESLEKLAEAVHPFDAGQQDDLLRRVPLQVCRQDAEVWTETKPVVLGVPLQQLCASQGIDFADTKTGKVYPCLPPTLIFLCEAMERMGVEEDFHDMFSVVSEEVLEVLRVIDDGCAIPFDMPGAGLWLGLKLLLDCLPTPLLSFQASEELWARGLQAGDILGQRSFLTTMFKERLLEDSAYSALYLGAFLFRMSMSSMVTPRPFAPHDLATVFAPSFFRPKEMTPEMVRQIPAMTDLVKTLIEHAEERELWIGAQFDVPVASVASSEKGWSNSSSPDPAIEDVGMAGADVCFEEVGWHDSSTPPSSELYDLGPSVSQVVSAT